MNDTSVSRIPLLPQARSLRSSSDLARHFLLRVLSHIRVGSLTIHDGDDTHHFGGAAVDGEPQAEIVVHNREAFGKVLTGGTIASGEAYIDGDWSTSGPHGGHAPVQRQHGQHGVHAGQPALVHALALRWPTP
jgi:cyclopropane-fatty-acyl-phospholipid synthase